MIALILTLSITVAQAFNPYAPCGSPDHNPKDPFCNDASKSQATRQVNQLQQIDAKCQNRCMAKGHAFGYCQKRCSY